MFTVNTKEFASLPDARAFAADLFNRTGAIVSIERTAKPMSKIKTGQAFQLEIDGPVWIKARGGFRPGCGGQLHTCQPNVIVYPYNSGHMIPTIEAHT